MKLFGWDVSRLIKLLLRKGEHAKKLAPEPTRTPPAEIVAQFGRKRRR